MPWDEDMQRPRARIGLMSDRARAAYEYVMWMANGKGDVMTKHRIEIETGDVICVDTVWDSSLGKWTACNSETYIGTGDTKEQTLDNLAAGLGGKLLAPGEFTTAEKLARVDALSLAIDRLYELEVRCPSEAKEGVGWAIRRLEQLLRTESQGLVFTTRGKIVSVQSSSSEWTTISVEMDHGARRSFVCSTSEDVHLLFLKRVEVVQSNNAVVEVRAVEDAK